MKRWIGCGVVVVLGLLALIGPAYAQNSAGGALTILIASPGEGETFYTAAQGFRLSMPIAGQVVSYDAPLEPDTVELTIELVEADGKRSSVSATLDETGSFIIWVSMLSTDLPWPSDDPHVEEVCGNCHRPRASLALPLDVTEVVVSARAADGRTGQVARRLSFDPGEYRDLPVVIEGLPETDASVRVRAETRIYNWRQRTFYATATDGQATLSVEGLFHVDLAYSVSMVPQIIDGTRYITVPESILLPRGESLAQPVVLTARPIRGALDGRLVDANTGGGLQADALLVNLSGGQSHALDVAADGSFALDDLDMDAYVIQAQADGYFHLPYHVDLTEALPTDVRVHLIPGGAGRVEGAVMAEGQPLPFAEARVAGHPPAYADPLTGRFVLPAVDPEESITVDVMAAGYYSARVSGAEGDLGTVEMVLRSDTEVLSIGEARFFRPATSVVQRLDDDTIVLDRGIAWVVGAAGSAVRLRVGAFLLQSEDADYSLESLPGAMPRLYVRRGEVQARRLDGDAVWTVAAGQTLALNDESRGPVDLLEGEGAVLRSIAGPVSTFLLAPTAAEQRDAAIKQVVVGLAQVFMLLAYLITLVLLPLAVIILGGRFLYRRRHSWQSDRFRR